MDGLFDARAPRHYDCNKPDQKGGFLLGPAWRRSYVLRTCRCNAVNCLVNRHLPPPVNVLSCELPRDPVLRDAIRAAYAAHDVRARERWERKWPAAKLDAIRRSQRDDEDKPWAVELAVKREGSHKRPTKARGIQGYANLATQARFGPEHMCFQEALADVFGRDGGYELYPGIRVAITCGWRSSDYDAWAADAPPGWLYRERDGANWDGSMQHGHFAAKYWYMRACSRGLAEHVARGGNARGRCRQEPFFKYSTYGTVKSGHNDTTSGNSLINALISAAVCHELGVGARIIVMGDDMLAAISKRADFDSAEARYGIVPESRVFERITDCTFVSSCFVDTARGARFTPLTGRLLARLWWTTKRVSHKSVRDYRYGVALGLASACGGNPFARALGAAALRHVPVNMRAVQAALDEWKYKTRADEQDDLTAGIAERYGWSVEQLRVYVKQVEEAGSQVHHHGWFDVVAAVDLCGIHER